VDRGEFSVSSVLYSLQKLNATGGLCLATTRAGLNAFEINNIQGEETKSH
jgi:hypothetical protein